MEQKIILDFSDVHSLMEIHGEIKSKLHLPDYGRTWGGFRECLISEPDRRMNIEIRGMRGMSCAFLGYMQVMINILKMMKKRLPNVKYKVKS